MFDSIPLEDLLDNPLLKFSGRRQSSHPDLLVEAVVTSGSRSLHVPVFTSYKHFSSKRWDWNEWLRLPVKFKDLPRDAVLCVNIYDAVVRRQ